MPGKKRNLTALEKKKILLIWLQGFQDTVALARRFSTSRDVIRRALNSEGIHLRRGGSRQL